MEEINRLVDTAYKFIMNNYSNPIFWIGMFSVLLAIALFAIRDLGGR